ncbi:GtrA family protein [Pseudoduganella plicata]|uniref:GtrA/DPMS transmembrane domain-containing protein n=2 Tax=Pseudoduganella plicata TaxID=321984 RepID=A0AA87Y1B9_9BURK|nr:GtrA family protein [Pseudoduganella plicata]GGY73588.1 hypothetical protein GCM10007388_02200 [Pseudoduganella plicata]
MTALRGLVSRRFAVYLVGGVLSALADVGTMQALLMGNVPAVPAASAGFAAGLLVNYSFHARVTFRDLAGGGTGTVLRYLCLVLVNYLITVAMVAASQRWLGMAMPGKLLSMPVVAVNGFLLGKHWIFRQRLPNSTD